MIPAKYIIINRLPTPTLSRHATAAEVNAIFRRLRRLKSATTSPAARANSNDRVAILIAACIDEGIDTDARIIGTMQKLSFDRRRIVTVLRDGVGHLWSEAENGRFSNLM